MYLQPVSSWAHPRGWEQLESGWSRHSLRAGGAAENKPRMWQLFGGEMDVVGPELSSLKSTVRFLFFLNFFLKDMLTLLTSSTGQRGKRSRAGVR